MESKQSRAVKQIPFVYVHPELADPTSRKEILKRLGIDDWAPQHKTEGAACTDWRAATTTVLPRMTVRPIPTGIAAKLPDGYELSARSRSGLFLENIFIMGTIDDDYTGEVKILLANFGASDFQVNFGDRIGQFKLSRYVRQEYVLKDKLPKTKRGSAGFGSTGVAK